MNWTAKRVSVQAGEYAEAQAVVTVHTSEDGRFVVEPAGRMRRVRQHGFYGQVAYRWVWAGYRLTVGGDVPGYLRPRGTFSTVRAAKVQAERTAVKVGWLALGEQVKAFTSEDLRDRLNDRAKDK